MAGIRPDSSIIADSTISPSPPPRAILEDTKDDETPTPVELESRMKAKRVARTYGRPKPQADVEDVAHNNLLSRARILKTAPRAADDQVIPESDDAIDIAPKFTYFPWRDTLKAIDQGLIIPGIGENSHQREGTASSMPRDLHASDTRGEPSGTNEIRVASGEPMESETSFDGSLTTLLSSEPTPSSSHATFECTYSDNDERVVASPKQSSSASHKRVIDNPIASDSNETSPEPSYAIDSPKRQSSSTPPTSPLGGLVLQESVAQLETGTKVTKDGNRNKSKGKGKERRTKALTKKEVIEMQKESARLLADRHVSLERPHARSIHSIASLFNKLKPQMANTSRPESDPILSFSSPRIMIRNSSQSSSDDLSPPKSTNVPPNAGSFKLKPTTMRSRGVPHDQDEGAEVGGDDGTDEDMPDAGALLREDTERRVRKEREQHGRTEARKRAMGLEEQKHKALEAVLRHAKASEIFHGDSDSDDDLEVEIMISPTRENEAKQTTFTVSSDEIKTTARPNSVSHKDLQEAAKPAFLTKEGGPRKRKGQRVSVSQKELNNLLLLRADRQGSAIELKKKAQWVKIGGVLKDHYHPETEGKLVDWLHKGSTRENAMDMEDEEDDEDDSEYEPADIQEQEGAESDIEASETGPLDDEPISQQHMDTSDEDADADKENHRPIVRRQTARVIVGSDDEETLDQEGVVFVPDTSLGDNSDDSSGGDKENNAELAFSVGENKENEGVPRHLERGRVIDGTQNGEFYLTPSPDSHVIGNSNRSRERLSRLDAESELVFGPGPLSQRRDPSLDNALQVLHEEDKDATLAPIASTSEPAFHRRSSSTSSEFENLDGPTLFSPVEFSQLFHGHRSDEPEPAPPALGAGGFSQFFSQSGDNKGGSSATPLKAKPQLQYSSAQSKDDDFEFTQPNTLLPSIKLSESQRREVDVMFGKDQEFKLDEAKRSKMLSQQAANSALDTLHFGSFIPSPIAQTPRSIRKPLETLSLEGRSDGMMSDHSPQTQPTRRSRLLRERPRERSNTSPDPSLVPRNAFDVLRDAASKTTQWERHSKREIGNSEYVEVEAQESDDEAMFGFGGSKSKDDEDEGGDESNMAVEGLVDDSIVDDKAQAADLVLQKHMEHQAVDDAALEKLHQDAVDGKLRGKRRDRGIGFEDSESEEDDVGSSHKVLYKKRRVEGDTLDAIGEDPETRPFLDAYRGGLIEPDEALDIGGNDTPYTQEMVGEEDTDDERTEVVDPIQVRRQIIEFRQSERPSSPELDPDDASWVDFDDQNMAQMGDVRVEDGPLKPRKASTSAHSKLDHVGYRGEFEVKKARQNEAQQLKTWASQESRAHNSATGRGGFSRKDDASGSSSQKHGKLAPVRNTTTSEGKVVVVKHSSLISHVEKRKGFND